MSSNPDFQTGDVVSYCGEEAVVVKNWGTSGTVRQGENYMTWYWTFDGEDVQLVRRANEARIAEYLSRNA